jgi:hypothetical protein
MYLYAGSSEDTNLYRAELSEAQYGNTWESVGSLSNPGIKCMASAFNKLFLGMRNKQFGIYTRIPESKLNPPESFLIDTNEQIINETESTVVHILNPDNIEDYDKETFDIQCFEVGHNQLFAGISNRPEVWSYSEVKINNPLNDEDWATQIFDQHHLLRYFFHYHNKIFFYHLCFVLHVFQKSLYYSIYLNSVNHRSCSHRHNHSYNYKK